ncbi:hypothetical protein B0A55_10775 [Friedmanniomyces simplex]|uniref:Xylanolytic transcriptional activator regulatory domain-containing protein n=1 Tax=Friedmanniomyces simplex TaxID=329884 RepID=A0A4U0WGM5_9PEZI|nr:hypothetical protein B0A55_10775 [Friedmanniomyces simplex]
MQQKRYRVFVIERSQKRRRLTDSEQTTPSSSRQRDESSAATTSGTEQLRPSLPSPQASRDETLNSFYQRGIGAHHWEVFHETDPIRIVYVGDSTANLHHLVQAEEPANRLHFPWPPIKPTLPWQPDTHHTAAAGYLTSAVAQDLASFPARTVRDALVQTYFDDIHPCYPVIDEEEFRRQYRDPNNPPPLILFHAVLLAAARISDHPMVASSRPTVTATLFRRAKSLFELRHENDRVYLVQAALLIAWHVEDSDTISSNSYHWVGQATRIALGLAAGIQFFQDMKSAVTTMALMRANAAHAQLERLLRPVDELSKYWPHVEALSKLCISLFDRGTAMLDDATVHQPGAPSQAEVPTQADISWQDIMAGYQLPDLRQGLDTEDWMYTL